MSLETAGVDLEGDINLRKRKRGQLNEEGEKRKKDKAKKVKKIVKDTRDVSRKRMEGKGKGKG